MARFGVFPALALLIVFKAAAAKRNYSDSVYEVCVNPWEPIVSCNATTNTFKGLDLEEFDTIAVVLKWKRVQPGHSCEEGQQCYRYKCLTHDEVEKDLTSPNGDCHMGTSLTVSKERLQAGMTFSFPVFRGKVDVLTKAEYTRGNGWGFTRPISWSVWLTVLLTGLLLVPTLLVVFEYISEQETFPRKMSDVAGGMSEAWWNSMTTLLQIDSASVRSAEAKIIMLGYAFLVLIIITSYTANMTSNLTITKIKANVETADDLNGKLIGTLPVYIPRLNNSNVYQSTPVPIKADAFTMEVSLKMLMNDEVHALAMSSQWVGAVLKWRGCKNDLYRFPLQVEPFDYALTFPERVPSKILFKINRAIMELSSGVKLQNIVNKFQARNQCGESQSVDPLTVFNMHHVYGVWVLMAGAVFLATMVSLTRCILKQRKMLPKFVKFEDHKEDIEKAGGLPVGDALLKGESRPDEKEYKVLLEIQNFRREFRESMALTQRIKHTKPESGEPQVPESAPLAIAEVNVTTKSV